MVEKTHEFDDIDRQHIDGLGQHLNALNEPFVSTTSGPEQQIVLDSMPLGTPTMTSDAFDQYEAYIHGGLTSATFVHSK